VRLSLRFPGLYEIKAAELERTGVDLAAVRPDHLVLRNNGAIVPLLVEARSETGLHPTDTLRFIGDYPRGDRFFFRPNNRYNVYFLSWDSAAPPEARWTVAPEQASDQATTKTIFQESLRLEIDNQRWFVSEAIGRTDHFFLNGIRPSPDPIFVQNFHAAGYAAETSQPLDMLVSFFGAVSPRPTTEPEHLVSLKWGEADLGEIQFSGVRDHHHTTSISAAELTSGPLSRPLTIHFPEDRAELVTLLMWDWMKVSYPRHLNPGDNQTLRFSGRLLNEDGTSASLPALAKVQGVEPGSRIFNLTTNQFLTVKEGQEAVVLVESEEQEFFVVRPGPSLIPDLVQHQRGLAAAHLGQIPADLEHLILYHSEMREAAERLAAYRRATGLSSMAVDAEEIQDALNHGFIDDGSQLKSYVRRAFDDAPGLRYLLLFADSTNNHRDVRPQIQIRQPEIMIPIHWVENTMVAWTQGFPDCNYYGALGASPTFPTLAVGRIPANNASEAMEAIRKIIEHEATPNREPGKALFVSSVEQNFQELVRQAEEMMRDRFTTTTLLFPATDKADQEVTRMTDEISAGADFLYYLGHGGQYVWRVGPTDFSRQKDLFTPAQVRQLRNSGRYPIITCSSCYTTSFDGPESLGESLILAPRAGAVALIGTTWKSTVYEDHAFNVRLMQAVMDGKSHPRIGDAFLKAKQATPPRNPTDTDAHAFTLLGDPALLVRMAPNPNSQPAPPQEAGRD
jgi:hypothetical protein